jgi:predicted enzyme related to lactoylglutathione lyase
VIIGDVARITANNSAIVLPRIATIALAVTPMGLLMRIIYFYIEREVGGGRLEAGSGKREAGSGKRGHQRGRMATVQVRYIVRDTDAAIAFYTTHLGFKVKMHPSPTFAMLERDALRLVLSVPNTAGGGCQSMPDGTAPEPGGWNRFAIEVDDLLFEPTIREARLDSVATPR